MELYLGYLACVLIMCIFFWRRSHTFRFYIKITYFYVVLLFLPGITIPVCLWKPRNFRSSRFPRWVWRKAYQDIPILKLTYDARDLERLELNVPCVIIANHQSALDIIGHAKFCPLRSTTIVKKSLLYAGTYGLSTWLSGAIFVDRSNSRQAKEAIDDIVNRLIKKKRLSLWSYPEGTRGMKDELQPFKKGAFNIAVQAQVPIVPIVFSSYKNFYDPERGICEPGTIIVQCLPSIPTKGLTLDNVTELTSSVREQMNKVFLEISKEVPIGKEFAEAALH